MVMPAPGDLFGRYRIVRFIARGGMGSVYEAEDTALRRSVALKVLVPELSQEPEFRARFAAEAHVLAGLDSPHVIKLFDHGEHDGQLYFVTQLVRGSDLAQVLDERGALPVEQALHLVTQVTSALADAHAAGLLHRDVKPSNVLVRDSDDDELFAYLIDFGIARTVDSDHTSTGQVVGTVAYMAPERHDGAPASVATDIYSLGCLLWALLDGRSPYPGRSGVALAVAHLQEPLPTYAGRGPAVEVNQVLARSMAKDPADRFASAAQMRTALRAVRAAATPSLPPPPRSAAEVTVLASAPPQPPPRTPVEPARPHGVVPAPRPRRWVVPLAVVAAVAVIGGGGAVLALRADPQPGAAPGAGATRASPSTPSSLADATSRSRQTSEPASSPTSEPASSPTSEPASSPTTDPTSSASEAATSPPSSLPATIVAVFPTAAGCSPRPTVTPGKIEVTVCAQGGYLVRYSRWVPEADRAGYLDAANGPVSQVWNVGGESIGSQWFSREAGDAQPFQWSATFDALPYSVSVEATTSQARRQGIDVVQASLRPPPS